MNDIEPAELYKTSIATTRVGSIFPIRDMARILGDMGYGGSIDLYEPMPEDNAKIHHLGLGKAEINKVFTMGTAEHTSLRARIAGASAKSGLHYKEHMFTLIHAEQRTLDETFRDVAKAITEAGYTGYKPDKEIAGVPVTDTNYSVVSAILPLRGRSPGPDGYFVNVMPYQLGVDGNRRRSIALVETVGMDGKKTYCLETRYLTDEEQQVE